MTDEQYDNLMAALGRIEALLAVGASVSSLPPGLARRVQPSLLNDVIVEGKSATDVLASVPTRPDTGRPTP